MPVKLKQLVRFTRINLCRRALLFDNASKNNSSNNFCDQSNRLHAATVNLYSISKSSFSTSCSNQFQEDTTSNESQFAKMDFVDGLIRLTLYLPGKREKCEFTVKLLNDTVGSLIDNLKLEDKSIEKANIYTTDGVRISQNTALGLVVTQPFTLKINEFTYYLQPPEQLLKQTVTTAHSVEAQSRKELDEIKQLVSKLYLHLNIEHYELEKSEQISKQLELLKTELQPMEKAREDLAANAKKHTNRMIWLGLGMMCVQMGVMARLTWFDYSWDIVEPISYFVSYAAVVGVYAYYVLTRKEYDYESASDRIFLRHFHKNAHKHNLDVNKYNELKDRAYLLERDLKKIKEIQMKTLTAMATIPTELNTKRATTTTTTQ